MNFFKNEMSLLTSDVISTTGGPTGAKYGSISAAFSGPRAHFTKQRLVIAPTEKVVHILVHREGTSPVFEFTSHLCQSPFNRNFYIFIHVFVSQLLKSS